ncbi:type II secretion system protein GspM [Azospirillum sp. ST 5-10]|uniref:type II secretion system protein GspM n=1 Tax=unclassified Azospirillum TaxID=2630922 RepID=UPI003F4A0056
MTLSPVVRRTLALGLLGLLLATGWRLAGAPLVDAALAEAETARDLRDRADRYRRLIAERPALEQRLAALQRRQRAEPTFLPQDTPAVAGAELQQWLRNAAQAHGTALTSLQILDPVAQDGMTRIAVRLRLEGRLDGIVALLHAVETARPLLFVEGAEVSQPRGAATAPGGPPLLLALDVHGYARQP